MPLGFQDPWLAGSKFLFKRENLVTGAGTTQYPVIDLGDIESASPNLVATTIEALDSSTGRIKTRDKRLIEFIESYQIQTRNLRQQVLALLFIASPPTNFVQSADTAKSLAGMTIFKGDLLKVEDVVAGVPYYPERIAGLYIGTIAFHTVTAVSKANKTITTSTNASAVTGNIILDRTNLANPKNSRTYSVISAIGAGPTVITVNESPAADETAISGQIVVNSGGTIYHQGNDWIPYLDHGLGFAKIMPGGAITDLATNVSARFSIPALSGMRLIKPKGLAGEARGRGYLIYSRSGEAEKTYREFQCVITPVSSAIASDAFSSATLNVQVLTDPSSEEPAGRLIQSIGTVPTLS